MPRFHLRPVVLVILGLSCAANAQSRELPLSALPDDTTLLKNLWQRSPDLVNARARIASAAAEAARTHRLPNPAVDFSVNTVPIGPTNPPDLPNPMQSVPNYNVGVSELVELGKRGPRQRAAQATAEATLQDSLAIARDRLFDFIETAGEVAAAESKVIALSQLVEDSSKLTALTKARVDKGDVAALEFDRAQLEEEKLRSTLAEQREQMAASLVTCSRIAGATCLPFGSSDEAEKFLHQRTRVLAEDIEELRRTIAQRPDVKSLELVAKSNEELLSLAHARAIPDPTLRVGYTRDQFVISGNQLNSLQFLVSLPIPLFERGQSDAIQASANLTAAQNTRTLTIERARADLQRLVEQARISDERRKSMHDKTLPLAKGVVERLAEAVRVGGAPVTDLLVARRLYGDILSDAADLDLTTLRFTLEVARSAGLGPSVTPEALVAPDE